MGIDFVKLVYRNMASTGRMETLPFLLSVLFMSGTSSTSSVNITAIVGHNVSLPCNLSSENANVVQMQWHRKVEGYKQGRPIVVYNPMFKGEYSHSKARLGVMQNPSDHLKRFYLDLEDLQSEDSGVYVCSINTFPSGTITQYVNLQVEGTSSTPMVNITAIVGHNVSLPCNLSSENASVVQMQWHREVEGHQQGRPIAVYSPLFEKGEHSHSKGRLRVMQNPSDHLKRFYLDLEDLKSEDSGVYVCKINTFPSGNITQYVNLQVQAAWKL